MSYIIISNIGLAIMILIVYLRYTHFRLSYKKELEQQKKIFDQRITELKNAEVIVDTDSLKAEAEKFETLSKQYQELEKQKESEVKLRINAEKQIEITVKKMQDLQSRIEDWSIIQDALLNDTRDTIVKIGNDLFKKLNDSYKQESLTNRNIISRIGKTVDEQKEFIGNEVIGKFLELKNIITSQSTTSNNLQSSPDKSIDQANDKNSSASQNISNSTTKNVAIIDQNTKKLLDDILETMKAAGRLSNKDFFLPSNLDEQRAKFLLCELTYISGDHCYLFDFKSIKFFTEYFVNSANDLDLAKKILKDKLQKYINYLGNPKYLEAILKVMTSLKIIKEKKSIIFAVSSKKEIALVKDLGLDDQLKQFNIEIMDFDLIVNVII